MVDMGATPDDTLAFSEQTFLLLTESDEGAFDLIVKQDALSEARDAERVDVFFVHAVPGAAELDIRIEGTQGGSTSLGVGQTSDYISLDAREHFVQVSNAPGGELLRRIYLDLSDEKGQAAALVLSGSISDGTLTLLAFDASGEAAPTPVEGLDAEPPHRLVLHGNYPNPFNPSTTIYFDLPEPARVRVDVFDLLGRRVLETPERRIAAGFGRSLMLEASSLASGAYFYRLIAKAEGRISIETGKMVMLR